MPDKDKPRRTPARAAAPQKASRTTKAAAKPKAQRKKPVRAPKAAAAPGSWALVTGASGGIGLELARQLAARGHGIVLVARSVDRLEAIAAELERDHQVRTRVLARDVAGGHAAAAVQQELAKDGIAIDVLVNNAGFGLHGPFVEADWDKQLQMMELNMVGLTAFTRAFGADMASRGHGQILNIASTAAFQPGPFMAVYYATKAYVLSFSEAVASELRDRGVTVTALCPGPTETGFAGAAGLEGNPLFGGRLMGKPMDAVSVARIGLRALDQGEPVVIAGLRNQFMARAGAFLPRKAVTAISRWVVEK